jgi:hypothetical protein
MRRAALADRLTRDLAGGQPCTAAEVILSRAALNGDMVESPEKLDSLIRAEMARIRIAAMKEFLRAHFVQPKLHYRRWDYAREPVSYPLLANR